MDSLDQETIDRLNVLLFERLLSYGRRHKGEEMELKQHREKILGILRTLDILANQARVHVPHSSTGQMEIIEVAIEAARNEACDQIYRLFPEEDDADDEA